jgi:hypothetical protein
MKHERWLLCSQQDCRDKALEALNTGTLFPEQGSWTFHLSDEKET